jgi:hypothetical protein
VDSYITPDRFKTMRTGAKTDGIPDIELAEVIADASAIADAYCNVPTTPVPHSFLGGSIVGEEHIWKYPDNVWDPGTRRIYLFHAPVRQVTAVTLAVAADATASLPPEQFVVNNQERWIEVTSLAIASNSGLFGVTGWIVPLGGLSDPVARVDYSYGDIFSSIDERAYAVDDTNLTFQTANGFWLVDNDHEVTVTANDLDVTPDSTDRETGRVTFASAPDLPVRVSYSYRCKPDVARATGHITAALLSASKRQSQLGGGVTQLRVGEIMIQRHAPAKEVAQYLDQAVPEAALLLAGHRFWWMA